MAEFANLIEVLRRRPAAGIDGCDCTVCRNQKMGRAEKRQSQEEGARAGRLLLRFLDKKQQKSWEKKGRLDLGRYEIRVAHLNRSTATGAVEVHDSTLNRTRGVFPMMEMPIEDYVLGLKLHIENDPEHFHRMCC